MMHQNCLVQDLKEKKKKKRLMVAVLEMKGTPTMGWEGERRKQKGEMKGMKKIIGCNFKNEVTQ